MAILGFPSTAIIGNLDWTGTSSALSASGDILLSTGGLLDFQSGSGINIEAAGTVFVSSVGSMTFSAVGPLSIGSVNDELNLTSNALSELSSNGNVSVTATEMLTLTGGNIISGGVSITTPQILNLGGEAGVTVQSQQNVYLLTPSVDGSLGLNLGSGVAELHVDDNASYVRVISDNEGVEIKGAGFVNIDAPFFQYKGVNVATQPFSIAMAIALG